MKLHFFPQIICVAFLQSVKCSNLTICPNHRGEQWADSKRCLGITGSGNRSGAPCNPANRIDWIQLENFVRNDWPWEYSVKSHHSKSETLLHFSAEPYFSQTGKFLCSYIWNIAVVAFDRTKLQTQVLEKSPHIGWSHRETNETNNDLTGSERWLNKKARFTESACRQ